MFVKTCLSTLKNPTKLPRPLDQEDARHSGEFSGMASSTLPQMEEMTSSQY